MKVCRSHTAVSELNFQNPVKTVQGKQQQQKKLSFVSSKNFDPGAEPNLKSCSSPTFFVVFTNLFTSCSFFLYFLKFWCQGIYFEPLQLVLQSVLVFLVGFWTMSSMPFAILLLPTDADSCNCGHDVMHSPCKLPVAGLGCALQL